MGLALKIRKGYRRSWKATPDEPLDGPIKIESVEGNSTQTVNDDGLSGFINGDGDIGLGSFEFVADGHIGEGEAVIRTRVDYEIVHPDATDLGLNFGDEEKIPVS